MSFFETPPEQLTIDGVNYPIDTDFRTWIKFQNIIISNKSDDEKTADLIYYISEMGLPFSENTIKSMVEFFKGGEIRKPKTDNKKIAYDFETDGSLIYSAFLTQYNFDLISEKMHWWKFKSLFSGLDDSHMISKIMWARTADQSKMSKEMKEYANKLRENYPLNVNNNQHKMT